MFAKLNSIHWIIILSNIVFLLWILWDGFQPGLGNLGSVQDLPKIVLLILLVANVVLLGSTIIKDADQE